MSNNQVQREVVQMEPKDWGLLCALVDTRKDPTKKGTWIIGQEYLLHRSKEDERISVTLNPSVNTLEFAGLWQILSKMAEEISEMEKTGDTRNTLTIGDVHQAWVIKNLQDLKTYETMVEFVSSNTTIEGDFNPTSNPER